MNKLLILAIVAILAYGCTVLPHSQAGAESKKRNAWALYVESVDQLEYIKKRDAFNWVDENGVQK